MINHYLEKLTEYLKNMVIIPPTELLYFTTKLSYQKVKKGEHFYHAGEMFDRIGFVVSGLLYNYYLKSDGEFVANYFIPEGMPATCYGNLITNTPAHFSCKALEDTHLITIKYEDFKKLYTRHPCWDKLGRLSAEKLYIEKEQREKDFLLMSAEERYNNYKENFPKLTERIPQHILSSFLRIRPETISRIKNNKY